MYLDKLIINSPRDHDGISFACDPQLIDPSYGISEWQGPFAHVRRCMYNRDSNHYVLNYAREFWSAYSNDRKMLMLSLLDLHEGTYTVIKHLDNPLVAFLKEVASQNTTIILFGDHGPHLGGIKAVLGFD